MAVTLHLGDCVTWARQYSGNPFHALFCDAPYEMEFMGKSWDGSGVAFDPETWKALARPLYDGAFLFVFAGTINDDLISYAMRQAGLRKYHKMMGWVYGSGFPKATRLNHGHPMTDTFEGHRYGLQALKPAIETVLIFQKPYKGKPIDNITETGAGVLNVDGGRIPANDGVPKFIKRGEENVTCYGDGLYGSNRTGEIDTVTGRWPANFYLDMEAARRLDEQSGERIGSKPIVRPSGFRRFNGTDYANGQEYYTENEYTSTGYSDSGGASRFFFRVSEQIDDADPVRYVAKASRSERDAGLDGFELHSRAEHDGRNLYKNGQNAKNGSGKIINGNGLVEPVRNPHPTIKPLALCKYLATLLLPPAEYAPRRLFVPFAGVASECIGAMQAGWEHVEGVELTEEYIPIGQARVEYWQKQAEQMVMPL